MTMTPMRRVGALAATFALAAGTLAATATTATAAAPKGIVTGKITQPGGATIPDAYIYLNAENGPDPADDVNANVQTGPDGNFTAAVPAGTYEVDVYDGSDYYSSVATTVVVDQGVEKVLNVQFTTLDPSPPAGVRFRIEPKVVGLAQVGVPLSVAPATFAQPGVSVTYQWSANGADVLGATGPVFVPTVDQVGAKLEVNYRASAPGLTTSGGYYAADGVVKRGDYVFASGPSVVGLPILGKTLTASAGALAPGAALSYQWFRNGAPIAGATAATYRVAKADYQRKLSAVITYKTFGYATVVRTVDAAFAAKKSAKLSTKISAGTKKATVTVKVKPSASKKLKGKITISENGKVLKRVSIKSASTKVTVSGLKKGKHKLTIVYEGRKYAAGTTKSVRIKK